VKTPAIVTPMRCPANADEPQPMIALERDAAATFSPYMKPEGSARPMEKSAATPRDVVSLAAATVRGRTGSTPVVS